MLGAFRSGLLHSGSDNQSLKPFEAYEIATGQTGSLASWHFGGFARA
jgi:hypothetical protein